MEVIRIIAFICVLFNHTGQYGYEFFSVTESGLIRFISVLLSNLSKTGVPLFFMVSGALLIPKKETFKDLFFKRVVKMFFVLILISLFYYIRLYLKHPEYGFSIVYFLKMVYMQPIVTPLWFLYVYIAFLMMLPFLRKMTVNLDDKEKGYFAVLAVSFGFIMPFLTGFAGGITYFNIPLLSVGILYPVMGYCIDTGFDKLNNDTGNKVPLFFRRGTFGVLLIIINVFGCYILTYGEFVKKGQWSFSYIESMVFIPAFCIFYLIKNMCGDGIKSMMLTRLINYVGSGIFIIYLFEEVLREDVCINVYRIFNKGCPIPVFIPYLISVFLLGMIPVIIIKFVKTNILFKSGKK